MSVPEAYKIQQIEGMQREMSRQKSEIVRLETSSNAMKDNELPLRQKSILVLEPQTLKKKDTEFDWKDRLRQWSQVQMSLGTISSFSQLGMSAFKSIPCTVIALMQAKHTREKL